MDIDTLIFSGGSVKGVSFLGSINYLIENDIIDFIFIFVFLEVGFF